MVGDASVRPQELGRAEEEAAVRRRRGVVGEEQSGGCCHAHHPFLSGTAALIQPRPPFLVFCFVLILSVLFGHISFSFSPMKSNVENDIKCCLLWLWLRHAW